jgi:hypothetical protein
VFWLAAIFDLRNIVLLEEYWGIKIATDSAFIVSIYVGSLILFLVLLFKPGSHNKSLKDVDALKRAP